jgi:hypothetical protein
VTQPSSRKTKRAPREAAATPDSGGRELLGEWRKLMDSVIASAGSLAGGAGLPRDLAKASQRQLELLQEVIERERRLQGELAARVIGPIDAVFDLLEETGETLRLQAEAIEAAGRALQDTAGLMAHQSERFERTVAALRQPADLARLASGAKRRSPKKPR